MDERIAKFIAALRSGGVRVSLAESADAFRAVEELGVLDRELFRLSMRSTLVKEAADLPTFDELFPLFFSVADSPPLMNVAEDLTPEEAQMLAQALRQFADRLRDMLERMLQGKQLSQRELEQLGQMVGLNRADNLRQKEWMARRMAQALVQEVQKRGENQVAGPKGHEQTATRPDAPDPAGEPAIDDGATSPICGAEDRREHDRVSPRTECRRATESTVQCPVRQGHGHPP
jgi:uncharacterized protein with von Willebrand factor type A (vWA) domain